MEAGGPHEVAKRPSPEVMDPPEFGSYLQCLQLLVKVSVNFCSFFRFMAGVHISGSQCHLEPRARSFMSSRLRQPGSDALALSICGPNRPCGHGNALAGHQLAPGGRQASRK